MLSVSTECTSIYVAELTTAKLMSKKSVLACFLAYFNCPFFFFERDYTHSSPERPERYLNFRIVSYGNRTKKREENKRNENWASKQHKHQPHIAIYRCWFGWMFFDHPHVVVIDRLLCIQLLCIALLCPFLKYFKLLFVFVLIYSVPIWFRFLPQPSRSQSYDKML